MGAIEDEKAYALLVRESANDGSDFTNPPADYRRLFVGEDGLFHLMDSSGTVTTPGGSSDLDAIISASAGQDIADALAGAALPDSGNVFATIADLSGGATPTAAAHKRTAGTYTSPTLSSTFVDVDGSNLSLTITTLARRVMVGLVAMGDSAATGIYGSIDVDLDGTRLGGGASGLHIWNQHDTLAIYNVGFVYLTDVLSAASHTFKLQWHNNSGATAVRLAGTASQPLRFWVAETMHTS